MALNVITLLCSGTTIKEKGGGEIFYLKYFKPLSGISEGGL